MYSIYSKYYDKIEATSQEVVSFILKSSEEFFPRAKSMLEIGCGTGNNLISLKESFGVTGLDISSEMLTIAKAKLPDVKFFIGDMASFNLGQKFDLIVSMYDSINHLNDLDTWKNCFLAVYKHLNEHGLFIFDINTLHKLNQMSESAEFTIDVEDKKLTMKVSKVNENTFDWKIDVGGESETILETAFDLDLVSSTLRDCQFEILKTCELNGNPTSETSKRVYFICRKI